MAKVFIDGRRDGYSPDQCGKTMTAGVDVADVVYQIDKRTREETVTLTYTCGATRDVCVTADSLIALTTDVISKL